MRSRKLLIPLAAVAVGGLTAAGAVLSSAAQAATTSVGLHVSGTQLLERNGTPFVERGVSHAHTWFASQTPTAIPAIRAAGANSIRIVLSGGRWTKNDAADVANVIALCKANKVVCMLEDHDTTGYGEQSGAYTLAQAADYWVSIASALQGQEDYVQINLGNEPYGNTDSVNATWASDTIAAIKKLRAAGLHHNVVVDAPNWGQDWKGTMRDQAKTVEAGDPDANTLFSVHMYGVYNSASVITTYLDAFKAAGLPLVIGEFGNMHSDGDPDEDTIMSEAVKRGVGYLGWSWSGNSGGVEYLDMVTSFDPNQLTSWGKRIFQGANGIVATAKTATIFGGSTNPPTTPTQTPTTPVTPTPTPTPTVTTPPTNGSCTATLKVVGSWPGGFQAGVTVTAGSASISSWSTSFALPSGASVQNGWSGTFTSAGQNVTVANAAWNGSLGARASTDYGFIGTGAAPTGTVTVACSAH
jgi:mannan endo-1,4-beta-mannosidase